MNDKIYKAVFDKLTHSAGKIIFKPEVHRIAMEVAVELLPPIQKSIYDELPSTANAIAQKLSIGKKLEMETKNVSSQLCQLRAKGFAELRDGVWWKTEYRG